MTTVKTNLADRDDAVAVVKKYANRRLYNTASSSYITLDELCQMVRDGKEFVVFDAKTGEDITRSVLTQIILEEDGKGRNLLPVSFLRQIIGYYDDNMRAFLPRYLEMSMEHFVGNQEQISRYIEGTLGRMFPFGGPFEDMARQNMALFKKAATAFTPFNVARAATDPAAPEDGSPAADAPADIPEDETERLRSRVRELEATVERLRAPKDKGRRGGPDA